MNEFHGAMDMPKFGDGPLKREQLRASLILEEALETINALGFDVVSTDYDDAPPAEMQNLKLVQTGPVDTIAVLDGLCDLTYVTMGCAVEMSEDIEPYFEEVHRSNMAKVGGGVRADGKRMKPAGWTPPDLRRVYDEEQVKAEKHSHREHVLSEDCWCNPMVSEYNRHTKEWVTVR